MVITLRSKLLKKHEIHEFIKIDLVIIINHSKSLVVAHQVSSTSVIWLVFIPVSCSCKQQEKHNRTCVQGKSCNSFSCTVHLLLKRLSIAILRSYFVIKF